jgi:hypothetical protein
MKLVTYMDDGKLRTLMVDWFLDRYNTADGWTVKYGVGDRMRDPHPPVRSVKLSPQLDIYATHIAAPHIVRRARGASA